MLVIINILWYWMVEVGKLKIDVVNFRWSNYLSQKLKLLGKGTTKYLL